jgi:hypothetical protein
MHTVVILIVKGNELHYFSDLKIVNVSSAVTGLEWPRGFQEVKVSRFHDNGTGWW